MNAPRFDRVRHRMADLSIDALLLSVGADLPWLAGYEAVPLERLTMLVVPRDGDATLVVPRLEAPRVAGRPGPFTVQPWEETDDPIAIVAGLVGGRTQLAIGDHTWARFLLALQHALPGARFGSASEITGPLRAVKDADEIVRLRRAARAVDEIAVAMGGRPFAGRTEADLHRELTERMLEGGHERVNFAIVGSGPNGASPHHEAGRRTIRDGDVVVCDFGGTMDGYCSDITRVYSVGEPGAEVGAAYAILRDAQEAAFVAAVVGAPAEEVDGAARQVIGAAGYGECFVHRTGHGIGVEAHEEPYIVAGNARPLVAGNAFSIEPGIYVAGRFGLRLEDVVVVTEAGPVRLNEAPRELVVVG